MRKDALGKERRRYIRLDSVFPVGCRFLSMEGGQFLSDWLQGFTNNIGGGGICLAINNLKPEFAQLLKERRVRLSLEIEMPLGTRPVAAKAAIAWVKELSPGPDNRYLIGLSYEGIDPAQNKRIMHYAWSKKLFIPVVLSAIIILGLLIGINTVINLKLIKGNKALVGQLIKIIQESSVAKQKIKEINKAKEDLQLKIQALKVRMQALDEERLALPRSSGRMSELNNLIAQLAKEESVLQEQLIFVQGRGNTITEELLRLDERKATLEKANLDRMYQWLKVHQNPRLGLVMSFEGDGDIADWASTYDQSLVAQAYINFSDFQRAKKILEFFNNKAERQKGGFFIAYYSSDGRPAEYDVQSGPNIWLGIAIMHYTKKANDSTYLSLAEEIAKDIIALQEQDKDGGISGGPYYLEWYFAEHNLDAYAFFNMLYQITNRPQYKAAADKVLSWLTQNIYAKDGPPVKRGKGDSTIATDTYARSIAAVGPEKLQELGMNPDRILEFAEANCVVEVSYTRPEGSSVKIKGFDVAPPQQFDRGGIVSSERTAQMVVAFKIMSDFYYKKGMIAKARTYAAKADEYLAGLSNMIISSPSASGQGESCLPYGTKDLAGHEWGSLAGTAYTLFAYYDYNPLKLQD